MRSSFRTLLFTAVAACVALASAPLALGQGVTTGAISGVVTDQDRGRLPGVTIEAVHVPTGTRYTTVTENEGRYSIANVRAGGPYTVTATLEGFRPADKTDVFARLGEDTRTSFELELGAVEEVVTVVGTANELINPTRTGSTSSVTSDQIENLPTISRGLEDFAKTNPFITVSSENENPGAISVAGRSGRYNNIQIDGAVNNDLFGLASQGTPGGQADATPISLDAIQELQLVIAPFDVRQGGFTGGGINAITRSGTNSWEGSVFYYTRDDSWVGDGPDVLGEFGEFEEDDYGFRLGGPIARDRAFFFVNGEFVDRTRPSGWSIDGSGGQVFRNGQAVDEANRFRQILIDKYGFDPGGLGQQAIDTPSDKLFGRLDFNPADNHQVTLRHNYVDATNDVNFPGSFTFEFPSETYLIQNETNSTVAQLNSVLGATMFNELRLTFQTIEDRRAGVVTFPWIEVENAVPGGGEFEAGTEPFSTKNSLDQDIFELTNDFTWVLGDHTVTLGTHNEFFTFDNLFIQNAFGSYEFANLDTLEAGIARRYQFTVVPEGQPESQKFDVDQIGLYAGDQWAARPNLTLIYGLRVDIPYFPDTPSRNELTEARYGFRTDEIPDGQEMWSPRLGFNWDILGDATQQLRGGLGLFSGRTPYVWISNNYARTGNEQIFITANNIPFFPDPTNQPTPITHPELFANAGLAIGEFNLIDPSFEFPQVWRYNLAYDMRLPWWDLIGTVEALHTQSEQEILYQNVNIRQVGTLPFDGRPFFTDVDPAVDGAFLITNTSEGEATHLAVKLEKPFSRGFWGYVAYVYSDSEVVNDGSSSRAVSNWQFNEAVDPNNPGTSRSDFEVSDRYTASLSYRFNRASDWPTTLTTYYNLQAGRPFTWLMNSEFVIDCDGDGDLDFGASINCDGFTGNDLFYVPSGPDDVVITNGTWEQLDSFISSHDCLDENRGGIAPRNCDEAPWSHTLDLHVDQRIPIRGTDLSLTFDIANLVNLIDEDSGVVRYIGFNAIAPVEYQGMTADGKPIYELFSQVRNPDANPLFSTHTVNSRWRAKLGVRWSF